MDIAWPLETPFYADLDSTGEIVDPRVMRQPEFGPPISRLKADALMEVWSLRFTFPSFAVSNTFHDWHRSTLKFGALSYIWRHPQTGGVTRWKMLDAPQRAFSGAQWSKVSFSAMRMPGDVWYADYVPRPYVRLPYFVADYENGVYGVDSAAGPSSLLTAVTGTYEVWTRLTNGTQTFSSMTFASGVPTTAPTGVLSYAGFVL